VKKFLKIMGTGILEKTVESVPECCGPHFLTRNADPDQNFHSDTDTDPDLASHFDVKAFHFHTGPDRLHKTMRTRNCTAGLVRNSDNFVRI
jgi:hypothetical protein